MQAFHVRKISHYENRDEYTNNSYVAVDWPKIFEHAGQIYTVELYGVSKNFPQNVSPTSIWLLISAGKGQSLLYFVQMTEPTWTYLEIFLSKVSYQAGEELPREITSTFTQQERYRLQEAFLSLCTYQAVEVNDWKGGGIEEFWNRKDALGVSRAVAESDAAERELYGGLTWQEQHDNL